MKESFLAGYFEHNREQWGTYEYATGFWIGNCSAYVRAKKGWAWFEFRVEFSHLILRLNVQLLGYMLEFNVMYYPRLAYKPPVLP